MARGRSESPTKAFNKYLEKHFSLAFQQRIFLLLKREDGLIKQFRAEWHIPEGGFVTEKEGKNWRENLAKIAPEKMRDVVYLEYENYYLLEKFTPAALVRSIDREQSFRVAKVEKDIYAVLDQELEMLLVRLKMHQDLLPVLRDYMAWGGASFGAIHNTDIMISERITEVPGFGEIDRKVCLTFGPNTDGSDLQDIYKYSVSDLQRTITGHLKGKLKSQRLFRLNLEVAKLCSTGKSAKQITDELAQKGIFKDVSQIDKILKAIKSY